MKAVEKYFEKTTVDHICAVLFFPENVEFDEQIKEKYIFVHLYDASLSKTKCWFCIRKANVPPRGRITFKVPELMMGRVIGTRGMNIKKIAKELDGRYVTVQKV